MRAEPLHQSIAAGAQRRQLGLKGSNIAEREIEASHFSFTPLLCHCHSPLLLLFYCYCYLFFSVRFGLFCFCVLWPRLQLVPAVLHKLKFGVNNIRFATTITQNEVRRMVGRHNAFIAHHPEAGTRKIILGGAKSIHREGFG